MIEEARLEDVGSGLAPVSPGWFVVNVQRSSHWATPRGLRGRLHLPVGRACLARASRSRLEQRFPQLGVTTCGAPARPSEWPLPCRVAQEGFLVLAGECLVLIEGEERALQQWDFRPLPARDGPHVRRRRRRSLRPTAGRRATGRQDVHVPTFGARARPGAPVSKRRLNRRRRRIRLFHIGDPGRPERESELPWNR